MNAPDENEKTPDEEFVLKGSRMLPLLLMGLAILILLAAGIDWRVSELHMFSMVGNDFKDVEEPGKAPGKKRRNCKQQDQQGFGAQFHDIRPASGNLGENR